MSYLPLYIDPGTGSMLLSLFIGIATAGIFGIRALWIKLQFIFSGGKVDKTVEIKNIPYVIFSDHKRYWNVFKPICYEFEKRKIQLVYYTSSEDDPVLSEKFNYVKAEFIGEGNKAFAKLNFLYADILMATTPNLNVYQWKRSKNVKKYVHIPHTVDDLAGYRMFGLDYYDAVLVSGENQVNLIRKIESLRPSIKEKELVEVGSTYMDAMKIMYQNCHKQKNENPVILVAPSWGKSGILTKYGEKLLKALESTGYNIIIRPHPQTVVSEQNILKPLQEKFTNFEWNFDNNNFEVLNKSDLLITDFSGIIFDYSLIFDKPLIYADTDFDTLPYDADWLDENIWSLRVLPKLGFCLEESQFNNMVTIIETALKSKTLDDGRKEIREECWSSYENCDSASRIVDWLILNKN